MLPQNRIRAEDLEKLTPAQQRLYRVRLETHPPRSVAECAERLGISRKVVESTWTRVRKAIDYNPIAGIAQRPGPKPSQAQKDLETIKQVAPQTMAELLAEKAKVLLDQISPERARKAGVGELSRGAESLLKTRALLLGEPTQILRVAEREHILDLLPRLVAEATQRGYRLRDGKAVHESAIDAEVVHEGH